MTANMSNQIVIDKTYFDNIKVAIEALNQFFASQFKTKAFPVVDKNFKLDQAVSKILSWLNDIEPQWIDNPQQHAIEIMTYLKGVMQKKTATGENEQLEPYVAIIYGSDRKAKDYYYSFVSFKILQYIAEHFEQFESLMNGIYTFELFTTPSEYRDAITTFMTPISVEELDALASHKMEYRVFDVENYVHGIFATDLIQLPDTMQEETEVQRIESFMDLQDVEVVVNEPVQEAADVNYFESFKPEHIKYDSKTKKFKISKQFEKAINKLVAGLRKCENTDDLAEFFKDDFWFNEVNMFINNVTPAILLRVFNNAKKFPFDTMGDRLEDYMKSFISIVKKNKGSVRFERIDVFSTFRTDKEGTIKFLEDFLKLNLVNDPNAVITNNTLMTVFNIFDSRIYLDIMYNMIPDDMKKDEFQTEDGFVKLIRARINQNSRKVNPYQKEKKTSNTLETSSQVVEEAFSVMRSFDGASDSDMMYCEEFAGAVYDEISALGDTMYNRGVSQIKIDQYIGESYQLFPELIQEGFISKLKQHSVMKKIEKIEKKYQKRLPELFINFITHTPPKDKPIKYTNGRGYLGVTFNLNDIYSSFSVMNISKVLLDNKLVMFSEFYDTDNLNEEVDDFDQYMRVLYYSLDDGSVMISQNPFNMRSFYRDDIKPFEESLESFLMHLEDWPGKPDVDPTDPDAEDDDEETEVEEKVSDDDGEESETIEVKEKEDDDDEETVQEQEMGEIPDYMKNRIALSDDPPKKSEKNPDPNEPITDLQLPPDIPINDIDDLADSINARLNVQDADSLGDMFGSGFKGTVQPPKNGGPGSVIYNITNNNYTNSHNVTTHTSDDHSTGKTSTTTITNTHNTNDLSSNKRTNTGSKNKPSNNYDNTRPSSNSKESEDTFSNGKSVQEVFALLDSKEPLFVESDAGTPPKGDLLTTAMDVDRTTLSGQQKLKRGVQKVGNTGKAIVKPIKRIKQWMTKMVDSFIKRDEDRVKAELVENPSYRTALYKVARLAIKFGLFSVFSQISPLLAIGYLGVQGLKLADRDRLRKEANDEIATEIQIIDQKIEDLKQHRYYGNDPSDDDKKELYKLMRMRAKLVQMSTDAHKRKFANTKSVY